MLWQNAKEMNVAESKLYARASEETFDIASVHFLQYNCSLSAAAADGMDQEEIGVQAREFLTFLEQCSQQPRASATSDITACLRDLHAFLERIQPVIESAVTNGSSTISHSETRTATVDASGLYPTIGLLLTHLCRNPVVLSSMPIADLIAQSVFKYSKQTGHQEHGRDRNAGSNNKQLSAERIWCAARMRDMFQVQQQQRHRGILESQGKRATTRTKGFEELFQVSELEMRQQRLHSTIMNLSQILEGLQETVMRKTPVKGVELAYLIQWNSQLSGLCAPLVSHPAAAALVEGIIDLAYSLKAEIGHDKTMPCSYLDSEFVEQNVALSRDEGMLTAIHSSDRALLRLCCVSPLAHQRLLTELMDRIMTASGQQPEFALSRKELVDQYFEQSPLFSAMTKTLPEGRELVQRVMESIAEVAGEIVDWRFVRICVFLVEWMTTRLQQIESETMQVDLTEDESKAGSEMDVLFDTMMASARLLLGQDRTSASTGSQSLEISRFLSAQRSYVFSSAGPEQFILRKRLAFLVNDAVAQCNGLLVHLICDHLQALGKSQERHSSSVALFMAELILPCESEPTISAVVDQLLALLKDLQELCSAYSRDPVLVVVALEEQLVQVFDRYRSILMLNTTLLANVICAMGIYMDTKDSTVWSAMVRPALSFTKDSRQGRTSIFPDALVVRLQDIVHIIDNPGLDVAQEELANHSRSVIND